MKDQPGQANGVRADHRVNGGTSVGSHCKRVANRSSYALWNPAGDGTLLHAIDGSAFLNIVGSRRGKREEYQKLARNLQKYTPP